MSGLKEKLLGAFNQFLGRGDDAVQGFDFKSYDNNVSQLLAAHNILNVRQVGGTFRITDKLAQTFKNMVFQQDFDVANVVLSDAKDEKASAYMVGVRHNGTYAIRSLHNIARPDDINNLIDSIQARIYAHGYRETLKASAELMRKEVTSGFYPERFVAGDQRPSLAPQKYAVA